MRGDLSRHNDNSGTGYKTHCMHKNQSVCRESCLEKEVEERSRSINKRKKKKVKGYVLGHCRVNFTGNVLEESTLQHQKVSFFVSREVTI